MKLFGRRSRSGHVDLARVAAFDDLAEQQKTTGKADEPIAEPQIRVLSDEELFGSRGVDATDESVARSRSDDQIELLSEVVPNDQPAGRTISLNLRPLRVTVPVSTDAPEPAPGTPDEPAVSEAARGKSGRASSPADGEAPALIGAEILIGGAEADLVPLIPDTKPEAESAELDDETSAAAAVDALRGACDLLVDRVQRMRAMRDGARFISAMIVVVAELDAKYADDWGIVRHNGLEEVLEEVRAIVTEGDRFVLESLENGQGGLTGEAFVRDLKTVALKDRPRIIAEYAIFLVFVYCCVLSQYLRPLENDPVRRQEMMSRLDYLIDGIREILIQHVSAEVRA